MTAAQAWQVFHPELLAVTVDNWSDDDYEDDPDKRQLAADIEAGLLTPGVLSEVEHCLTRDWCTGRLLTAALTVLAAHGCLEEFDPAAVCSRRPRTRVLLGKRWVIG